MDRVRLTLDTQADKYVLERTVDASRINSFLQEQRAEVSGINRNKKSNFKLKASIPAEEFVYNEDLKKMLWYQEQGEHNKAKAFLNKFLSENSAYRMD